MAPRAIAPKGMTRRRPGLSLACGDPHWHAHTGLRVHVHRPDRAARGAPRQAQRVCQHDSAVNLSGVARVDPRWPGSWPIFAGCGQRSRTIRVRAGVLNGEGGIRTLVRREPRNRFSRPAHDRENAGGYRGFSVRGTKKGMRGHFRVVLGGLAGLAGLAGVVGAEGTVGGDGCRGRAREMSAATLWRGGTSEHCVGLYARRRQDGDVSRGRG